MKRLYRVLESSGRIEGRQSVDKEQVCFYYLLQGPSPGGFEKPEKRTGPAAGVVGYI